MTGLVTLHLALKGREVSSLARSNARTHKNALATGTAVYQEPIGVGMALLSTTNKTLKLYAENQPKALLISKGTL